MNWMTIFFTSKYSVLVFVGALIFLSVYKKQKHFYLRLLLPVALLFVGSFVTSFMPYSNQVCNFFRFLIMNLLMFLGMIFCYKTPPSTVLFSSTAAMALQQFCAGLLSLIRLVCSLQNLIPNYIVRSIIEELIVFTPFYVLIFCFLVKWVKGRNYNSVNLKMKIMSAAIVFICIGVYRFADTSSISGTIVSALYSMTCCSFALVIQFELHEHSILKQNLLLEKELRRQEMKHYENWRDSVDVINVKYHDLKHQIASLRNNKSEAEDWLEIERALATYDDLLKTGNSVLDIILSEKKMLADKFEVTMTCMVDGQALKFLKEPEIYSFFGNALDNAMNAVKEVADKNKRNISVIVRKAGEVVVIHIENNFEGDIIFADGFPQTSGDKNFHGYGMKSIKMLVDKYNGTISMSPNNNLFSLDIMLPIPKQRAN